MKISKEAKIGLIITSGIAILFWGLNYLKGKDFFTSQKTVFATYDRVDGLTASNPVLVNGMKIGSVTKLSLLPDQSGRILVAMHINSNVRIPRNSTAEIFSTDLLGAKGIRFLFGESADIIEDGDTVKSQIQNSLSQEVNAQVAPIRARAESILSSMDSVLMIVRTVFNESTKEDLRRSFQSISSSLLSIERITGTMDQQLARQGKLGLIFDNLESITTNLRSNNKSLTNAIENFSAISDTLAGANLAATIENTRKTLEGTTALLAKVNSGEGSLGQLATNDSLYTNLNNTARDLDLLITDLKANPGRYVHISVFGKKSK
jgi:phospholipid/cholesterol/gamma-HCH transport system substrate-binding protein